MTSSGIAAYSDTLTLLTHCTLAREHELVSMEADTSGQEEEEEGDTAEVVTRQEPELRRRRSKLRKVVQIIERYPPIITYHMV